MVVDIRLDDVSAFLFTQITSRGTVIATTAQIFLRVSEMPMVLTSPVAELFRDEWEKHKLPKTKKTKCKLPTPAKTPE